MKSSLLILTTIVFFGIQNLSSQTGPKPTKDSTVYKGVTDKTCAVEMAFGSYGAGIDSQAFEKVMALIKDNKLESTSKNIGREGEQRVCLPMKGLKSKTKKKLIIQLKKIAKSGKLVSISIR